MSENNVPIISIVGRSGTGKTTLIEKLLRELKARGYRVATIKHDAHPFEIDQPGKDSWRHAQAGSDTVVISAADRLAMIKRLDREWSIDRIAGALLGDVDLVLTEGYKRSDKPRIEVSRRACGRELVSTASQLVALATDQPFNEGELASVPQFQLDDAAGLVDLIEKRFLRRQRPASDRFQG
jgi:molybdopterin-guanine dinucleotide biosynthesis protein B